MTLICKDENLGTSKQQRREDTSIQSQISLDQYPANNSFTAPVKMLLFNYKTAALCDAGRQSAQKAPSPSDGLNNV